MKDLIAKLEAATGPSRELDLQISVTTNYKAVFGNGIAWRWSVMGDEIETVNLPRSVLDPVQFVPRWTASVDAALTLVPEGDRDLNLERTSRGGPGWGPWQARVSIDTVADDPDETGPQGIGEGKTAAIALCIAALRARMAVKDA